MWIQTQTENSFKNLTLNTLKNVKLKFLKQFQVTFIKISKKYVVVHDVILIDLIKIL